MFRIFSIVFLMFTAATTALADTKRGIELFNAEDYAGAEKEFQAPVAAGDTVAIRYYANMLYLARGVPQDRPRAKALLREAYEKGDKASGTYLASLLTNYWAHFTTSDPTDEDYERKREAVKLFEETYTGPTQQAPATNIVNISIDTKGRIAPKGNIILWFKRAVREGHGLSAWHLAIAYSKGNGVKQDTKEAFYWAEYAAFLEHPEAQTAVGEMYAEGRFGPIRQDEALALIVQAAKERHNPAMLHVAGHFANQKSQHDLGMAWRVLHLAYDRGMEKSDRSKGLSEFLLARSADQSAKSIDDYSYNGTFEALIQSTTPDYQKALKDFSSRIKPYSE